jgi:hypothetical protein
MSKLILCAVLFFSFAVDGKSQYDLKDTTRILIDNKEMKVTQYSSTPGKDMCGKGRHSHGPHLSIFLTDAKARLIMDDGTVRDFDFKAGTTFWSGAETHTVINTGDKPATAYTIDVKQ